jgi:NAD/NADP transhydrogenase beta subunit
MGGSAIVAINNMRRVDFDMGLFVSVFAGMVLFVGVCIVITELKDKYQRRWGIIMTFFYDNRKLLLVILAANIISGILLVSFFNSAIWKALFTG